MNIYLLKKCIMEFQDDCFTFCFCIIPFSDQNKCLGSIFIYINCLTTSLVTNLLFHGSDLFRVVTELEEV